MKKVLLIVDEPKMWEFMTFYLAMQSCKAHRSSRIEDVFKQSPASKPDLVVIDNTSGRIDLLSFYKKAVNEPSLAGTQLLLLGSAADQRALKSVQREQDVVITRPLRPKMLLIIIRSLIHHEKPDWIKTSPRQSFPAA